MSKHEPATPHGDEFTRRTLSNYLVHQLCGYPYPIAAAAPRLTDVAFGRRLREFYCPLLASTARKVWQRLDLRAERKQERQDIQREVDSAFNLFLKDFDFLAHRASGLTPHGMLGMNEESELQSLLDEVAVGLGFSLRSPDLAEVPFAHYIEQKMKFWLEERYPQISGEILTSNTDYRPARWAR